MIFKRLSVITLLFVCAAFGQTAPVQQMFALGASYAPGASPSLAGTGMYACLPAACSFGLSTASPVQGNTYAFAVVDAIPAGVSPFTVTTDIALGVAEHVASIGPVNFYIPLAAGFTYTGTNTGWNWSTGALAAIHLTGSTYIMPNVRALKTSVGGGTGYQVIAGMLFGWGK